MKIGDITHIQYLVMLGEKTIQAFNSEEMAIEYANRIGGTIKKVEWKYAGKSK